MIALAQTSRGSEFPQGNAVIGGDEGQSDLIGGFEAPRSGRGRNRSRSTHAAGSGRSLMTTAG